MNDSVSAKKTSERIKYTAVAILAVILGVVLLFSPGSEPEAADSVEGSPTDSARATDLSAVTSSADSTTSLVQAPVPPGATSGLIEPASGVPAVSPPVTQMPVIDLERMAATNPFRSQCAPHLGAVAVETMNGTSIGHVKSDAANISSSQGGYLVDEVQTQSGESEANGGSPDPMEVPERPSFFITAIATGNGRPAVLIKNTLYHENDIVDDRWRLVAIRRTGVVLEPLPATVE